MADSATLAMLTSVTGIPAGAATSLLGGSAATAAMQDAHAKGLTDDQALVTGLYSGVFESLFEKVSLDNLLSMAKQAKGKVLTSAKVSTEGATLGGVTYNAVDTSTLTKRQIQEMNLIIAMAESGALGVDKVVLYQSTDEQQRKNGTPNGAYKDGVLYLDVNAWKTAANARAAMMQVMGHELTHSLEGTEAYNDLKEFVLNNISEDQQAVIRENLQRQGYSEDELESEMVANACEFVLQDSEAIQALVRENMTLAQKIRDFFQRFAEKVRKAFEGTTAKTAEARAMMDYLEELTQLWDNALMEKVTGVNKNATTEGDGQMSIRNVDGNEVVWLDSPTLGRKIITNATQMKAYISEHIGEIYTIIESGQRVYLGDDLPGEYVHSKYTGKLRATDNPALRAKNKAAAQLGELIETASNRRWEKTRHPGSKDAKFGMYRYDVRFAFETNATWGKRFQAYTAEILIRNASDGKKYLYDIVEVKKDTNTLISLTQAETRRAGTKTRSGIDISTEDDTTSSEVVKVSDVISSEDSDGFYDSKAQMSMRVTDQETLDFLDNQEYITTYKTMQLVDGKLYPPMAARVNGKYEDHSVLGQWEAATEHPELATADGKFKLDKGKGNGSIQAAYNPYMHSSNLVLNDQFSGAYKRDNLVTVECRVPVSEVSSGYRAENAKDAVGWHAWHTGTVAGAVRAQKGTERQVFLSRWIQPVRILSDAETAQMYKELLDGTDVSVPDNVVTPGLLQELRNAGVSITETDRVRKYKGEKLATLVEMDGGETITDGAVVEQNGLRYSIRSMEHDIDEGVMFKDLMEMCNWSQDEVDVLRKQLTDLVEYMRPNRDILDMNESYGREGRRFSPYKPNSDPLYKISMDFSTLCSKRLLTQHVIEQLQLQENRPLSAEEQMAVRHMLNEYRTKEQAIQVACVMCYVEAARLKSPKQIQRWIDDPTVELKKYFASKNKEFMASVKKAQGDFKERHGVDRGATKDTLKNVAGAKAVTEYNKISPALRAKYTPSAEEQAIIDKAVSLPASTYLTAANLADLRSTDPVIYDAYSAFVRTATRSKALESDEAYYYGDSSRDNGNGIVVSDAFIDSVNAENGMRFSSWSDWRVQHLLDYITAVIEMANRGAMMHGYTKFADEVRVLGKTGMMFNLSGVPGTANGLNEDGTLSFSKTESIDETDARELREEFPETAGVQCIGVSDEHITALMASDVIDYIIPYHTSGLNATLRRMGRINKWSDYTSTQNASKVKGIKKGSVADPEHFQVEPVFSEFFVGYDTGLSGIEAMRQSAENYKRMCEERGLIPKFEKFSTDENYWKLLIDRKMINQKTGELIRQKPVTPTFDFDVIKQIVDKNVANYDAGLEDRVTNYVRENWDQVPGVIKELKKKEKAKKAAKKTKKAKKVQTALDTLASETLAAQPADGTQYSRRDSDGNELSYEQQEYFWDSKIRDEDGNLLVVYHGTDAEFTVFDHTKGRANMDIQGMFFSPWDIDAGGYGSDVKAFYLNITNPADEDTGYKALRKFQGQNEAGKKAREYLISLGYDGVNNSDEEYIAFYPEQIKESSNTSPTSDPDYRYSFRGYDEQGRGMYEGNFPSGTPKQAKSDRILHLIQDVWSKKPVSLTILDGDTPRVITANFDPTYSNKPGEFTDASKLAGGNRHGTSKEQRVTLDLADDYYRIITEAAYTRSKTETGKDKKTHEGVKAWHYFANDIMFAENGSNTLTPYTVEIDVKERTDGSFVYSVHAELTEKVKKRRSSTQRTLHAADISDLSARENAQSSTSEYSTDSENVKEQLSRRDARFLFPTSSSTQEIEKAGQSLDDNEGDIMAVARGRSPLGEEEWPMRIVIPEVRSKKWVRQITEIVFEYDD